MKKIHDKSLKEVWWTKINREPVFCSARDSLPAEFDLAVIGGGLCGLSIALHSILNGLSVVLIEAETVGNGGSGRNGGIVVPQFPKAIRPSLVHRQIGAHRAERLIQNVLTGPSCMFDLIHQHNIDCDAEQTGWIQPAHSQKSLQQVRAVFDEWKSLGAKCTWLERDEVHARLGASGYLGGWFAETGGTINPYALVQGLARVATAKGLNILQNSRVKSITREDPVKILRGDRFETRARKVVFATNGYTEPHYPGLDRSIIPIRLFQTFTRPLTADEQEQVMPGRIPFTDTRKATGFCRYDLSGRILGGGAVFNIGDARSNGIQFSLKRFHTLFPQLRNLQIEHYWEGYCALSDNYLPSVQVLDREVYSVIGFSTRGVSLAQSLGRELAGFLSEKVSESDLPVEVRSIAPIPFQPLKKHLGGYMFPAFHAGDQLGFS